MPTTPNRGYPKPAATDPFANGWDAIADLADAIDLDVKATRAAPYARAETAVDFGTVAGGATATVSHLVDVEESGVTHAAGVFTIAEAGVYELTAWFKQTPTSGAPFHGCQFYFGVNGTGLRTPAWYAGDNSGASQQRDTLSETVRLAAGDTVRLVAVGMGTQTTVHNAGMTVIKVRD